MNEGHAAFLAIELARELVAARPAPSRRRIEAVAAQCVFTTHTPVAAGHDAFPDQLFAEHFGGMAAAHRRRTWSRCWRWAARRAVDGRFNMTRLALNCARRINGVSRIHGAVSSQLCADHWPEIPAEENPVGYVTNGVHVPTFLSTAVGTASSTSSCRNGATRLRDVGILAGSGRAARRARSGPRRRT